MSPGIFTSTAWVTSTGPTAPVQSLEYLKRFGLKLPHSVTVAGPARHAEVLLAHMVRFGASLQGHFAGVIGWDAVNLSFAPYLAGMGEREVEQFAQMLIYEFSQLTSARGGQAIFTDIHLYWEVPAFLADLPAVGPGGKPTGRTYREYGEESRSFARALMAVYREGDATGKPFIFPRPIVHITDEFFRTPGHEEFLEEACGVAAAKGNPCFVLDREAGRPHRPLRLHGFRRRSRGRRARALEKEMRVDPERHPQPSPPRLPGLGRDDGKLFSLLDEVMALAAKAHVQKRDFIEKLLSLGTPDRSPCSRCKTTASPYLRMADATYLIGVTGLNELVQIRKGRQLARVGRGPGLRPGGHRPHAGRGRETLRHPWDEVRSGTDPRGDHRLPFRPSRPEAFLPAAGPLRPGRSGQGEIYYTNSTHLHPAAPVDPLTRIRMEGRFHPFFRAGAVTHIELGAAEPPAARPRRLCRPGVSGDAEQPDRLFPRIHLLRPLRRHLRGDSCRNARIAGPKRWTALPGSPSISAGSPAGTGESGPNSATGTATKDAFPPEITP